PANREKNKENTTSATKPNRTSRSSQVSRRLIFLTPFYSQPRQVEGEDRPRPPAPGIHSANIKLCRLDAGMAQVVLDRHEVHTRRVLLPGVEAPQFVMPDHAYLASDHDRVAAHDVQHLAF